MNLPTILLTIQWMVRDTVRQAVASKLFWVLAGSVALCIALCLSVQVRGDDALPVAPGEQAEKISRELASQNGWRILETSGAAHLAGAAVIKDMAERVGRDDARRKGVDVPTGEVSVGFGAFTVRELGRDRLDTVRFLQVMLAELIADKLGILLALIWTAGFLPTFLEPNSITVLLAKPVPRWALLIGKAVGVMLFVSGIAVVFVLGTWLALGVRTGIFDAAYLLSIPLMIIHFGVFYSFSVLMAVWSRNTTVTLLATLLFWGICWCMNLGWVYVHSENLTALTGGASRVLLDAGYWMLPKPLDLNIILYDALQADGITVKLPQFQRLQAMGLFNPILSVLASCLFAVVMLVCAAWEFKTQEY